jgi:hypothetical protein
MTRTLMAERDDTIDALIYALEAQALRKLDAKRRRERFYRMRNVRYLQDLYHQMMMFFWLALGLILALPRVAPHVRQLPLHVAELLLGWPLVISFWCAGWLRNRARDIGGFWYHGSYQDPL